MTTPKHVLAVYSGWLGDLVWLVPSLHALRRAFDRVSLVVSSVQAPLAEIMKNGLVEEVYVDIPSERGASARATRQRALAKGVDACVDFKGRWKTGIYMPWRLAHDYRILIPHRRDTKEYVLSKLLHPQAECMPARADGHMVDAYLSGLRAFGVENTPVSFALPFRAETVAAGKRIADREGLRSARSVALNPGSAQFSKIWPPEHFRRLAEILKHDLACKVVLMGSRAFAPNDNYDARVSREYFADGLVANLVEETDLAVDAYLLSSGAFDVTVGNDSFAGHMAGSASEVDPGTSGAVQSSSGRWYKANHTVSLFGPTNPVFCRPYDPTGVFNAAIFPASYPAGCAYDRHAHVCPHYGDRYCVDRAHCMRNITVERVAEAVEAKLRQSGK